MKIGRLNIEIVDKGGKATLTFSRFWDQLAGIVERFVNAGDAYEAMTGPSVDTVVYDTTTITLPQLAARMKALEDRIVG